MPFQPHTHQHEPYHPKKEHLSTFVYGAIDGTVTTFAVVAGVVGAQLSASVILILGFANLLGDGFSMAVSNYLSEKAKQQYIDKLRQRELWEMKHLPDVERQEIRDIYHKKGFKGKDLDRAVEIITSNDKVWLDTMMKDELGIIENNEEPTKSAVITFLAFNLVGFIPLLAYATAFFVPSLMEDAFLLAILLTSAAFLTVGAVKAKIVSKNPVSAALETLFVGGTAAAIAYLVGYLLRGVVG
ncbi:VIT1/CCC1 transporter family protein [Candidatus Woesearchaeota archaeon]|nr:VIT1/CCC1 transporter family protein [Candidatus Woesearchaeota archaeon]